MPKKRQRFPHQADTRGAPWAGIPHVVLKSDAYIDLSMHARSVLLEIVLQFNGNNNGVIGVGYAHLTRRLNNTNKTKIKNSIVELVSHGFISTEADADWKGRRVREYRLTFVNTTPGGRHKPATNDYRDWEKPQQKAGCTSLPLTSVNGDPSLPLRKKNGNASLPDRFEHMRKTAKKPSIEEPMNGYAPLPHIDTIPLMQKKGEPRNVQSQQSLVSEGIGTSDFCSIVRMQIAEGWSVLAPSSKNDLARRNGVSECEIDFYIRGDQKFSTAKLMAIRSDLFRG